MNPQTPNESGNGLETSSHDSINLIEYGDVFSVTAANGPSGSLEPAMPEADRTSF
jgi:hypothetical protein